MDSRFDEYADSEQIARLDAWQNSLTVAPKTKEAYASALLALLKFVRESAFDFGALDKSDIELFRGWMVQCDYSPATISLYLAGVRSYYRFMGSHNEALDIAHSVKGMKASKKFKKEALSREQAQEMLAAIDRTTLPGKRDYALLNLMLRTGLRDIEISRALYGDISFEADSDIAILQVQGKGRHEKDDFVVLEEAALSPLREYLLERSKATGGSVIDSEPLFSSLAHNSTGGPLTTRSISRIVKNRLDAIGLTGGKYTAHSLRHSAVTFSLLGGATVQEAQAMARHANINTTLIYAHNINRLKNAAEGKAGSYLDGDA